MNAKTCAKCTYALPGQPNYGGRPRSKVCLCFPGMPEFRNALRAFLRLRPMPEEVGRPNTTNPALVRRG